MLENFIRDEEIDLLYTPSLVCPHNNVAPLQSSLQKKVKVDGKNSMEKLFEVQNWNIKIKFLYMVET